MQDAHGVAVLNDGDRTDWLGREDSNLCILESEFTKTLSRGAGLELAHLELEVRGPRFLKKSGARPTAQIPLSHDEVQQI